MDLEQIAEKCRCGACGGTIAGGHINLYQLDKWAVWEHPAFGNVLTEEKQRACAVLCESCFDDRAPPIEAIEFSGDDVVYHPLEELEDAPPPQSYVIVRDNRGRPGIECLHCGLVSWNINDVDHRYCGNCRQFHNF